MSRHTIRRARAGWRCSCGVPLADDTAAETHAHAVSGSIEMGGTR